MRPHKKIKSEEEEECTNFPKLVINQLPEDKKRNAGGEKFNTRLQKKIKSEEEEECTKLEIIQLPKNEVKQEIDEDEAEADTSFPFKRGGEKIIYGKYYSTVLYKYEGTCAKILECMDLDKGTACNIKIFHGNQTCCDKGLHEIKILNLLADADPTGKYFVKMLDSSKYGNHVYIVQSNYGPGLRLYLKRANNGLYPHFRSSGIKFFGRQILESVALMHDQHLIHADLKPDHIVFVSRHTKLLEVYDTKGERVKAKLVPFPYCVRVIGFTSTEICEEEDVVFRDDIISSRPYRAPEVILGLGWSYPCDIWSIGCILWELWSRCQVFDRTNDDDFQHLALMELRVGKFPSHMLEKSTRAVGERFKNERWNLPEDMTKEFTPLRDFPCLEPEFLDVLQGLLKLDPSERLTARGALEHPFFCN